MRAKPLEHSTLADAEPETGTGTFFIQSSMVISFAAIIFFVRISELLLYFKNKIKLNIYELYNIIGTDVSILLYI